MKFDDETVSLIRLQAALGIGSARLPAVISHFGSAENVFAAGKSELAASGMLTASQISRVLKFDAQFAKRILSECAKADIRVIAFGSREYPECLRNIPDPPAVLYVKGDWYDFDNFPAFCIVGPRNISEFGKKAAYSLSYRLARGGMAIVSGGAVGGDAYAHLGALKAGGKTVAVLPCGIGYKYLEANRELREKIIRSGGCLVSECPPEYGVKKYSFQIRNRLLSALSCGVAITEAAQRSGTLITARHANDQGRDVFVIPGNPTLPQYKGSNALLRDGARPLIDATDIFSEYLPRFGDKLDIARAFAPEEKRQNKPVCEPADSKPQKKFQKKSVQGLSKEAKIVYNNLNKPKFTADDIPQTGLSDDELLSALTELEMEDCIRALPGGLYQLV